MQRRGRQMILYLAAFVLAGCAARPPQREIVVYVGPRDPAYEIPAHLREAHQRERQSRLGAAIFQQQVADLNERVRSDESFGGLVLRWNPEPHAVVMFTSNAEAKLRRYTTDPRFKAQRVDLTLAQLEHFKDQFGTQLSQLALQCYSVDGDEEHNAVSVGAPASELAKVRSAISDGRIKAPPKLRLKEEGCAELR